MNSRASGRPLYQALRRPRAGVSSKLQIRKQSPKSPSYWAMRVLMRKPSRCLLWRSGQPPPGDGRRPIPPNSHSLVICSPNKQKHKSGQIWMTASEVISLQLPRWVSLMGFLCASEVKRQEIPLCVLPGTRDIRQGLRTPLIPRKT